MKKKLSKKSYLRNIGISILLVIGMGFSSVMPFSHHAQGAATADFILLPTTSNLVDQSTLEFIIQVNAGTNNILGAQACLTYDPAKLQPINIDASSSALGGVPPAVADEDCPATEVKVNRFAVNLATGAITSATGTFTLAKVTFMAKVGGTTATVGFDGNLSFIQDDSGTGNSILGSSIGSLLTLTNIPAPPPSPNPVTPPPTITTTTTTTPPANSTGSSSKPAVTTTVTPSSKKSIPAYVDTKHISTSPTEPAQAASSEVITGVITPKVQAVIAKKASSNTTTYLAIALVSMLIVAIGLFLKFFRPQLSPFSNKKMVNSGMTTGGLSSAPYNPTLQNTTPIQAVPSAPVTTVATPPSSSVNLSNIPDPQIPAPSTVVHPTESQEKSDEQ